MLRHHAPNALFVQGLGELVRILNTRVRRALNSPSLAETMPLAHSLVL